MPLAVSTLTPLDPSPGYGPAVSSGISDVLADESAEAGADGVVDAATPQPARAKCPGAAEDAQQPAPAQQGRQVVREPAVVLVNVPGVVMVAVSAISRGTSLRFALAGSLCGPMRPLCKAIRNSGLDLD